MAHRPASPGTRVPLFLSIALLFGIFLGVLISRFMPDQVTEVQVVKPDGGTPKGLVDEVLQHIDVHYVDTIDDRRLEEEAVSSILEGLDPHSFYIPPRNLQAVNEDLDGEFQGIGIEFFVVRDTITVVTPIAGGPSEELGIRAGDKIIEIDDTLVAGIDITNRQVMNKLRGPKGSEVSVGILRAGSPELIDYRITRDDIPLISVDAGYMLDETSGYIKINRFSATTHQEFYETLKPLVDQGMDELVIDLRQNPGGYLNAAVRIADELLDGEKLVVYTEGKASPRYDYVANKPGLFESGEVTVLIDEGSASASEILAGAIQDWDRGMVVGRRSYGKGLVQDQFILRDDGALRLTVAKYYTPSGRCIQRPYEDGIDAYYDDFYERYENGELYTADSVKFSDTTTYYTLVEERPVYGGGGIMPDVFHPADTVRNNRYTARLRQYIPEFVYGYYANHAGDFTRFDRVNDFVNGFSVSDALLQDFLDHAEGTGWRGDRSRLDRGDNASAIRHQIKAFIAKQIWKYPGYYRVMNEEDAMLERALGAARHSRM